MSKLYSRRFVIVRSSATEDVRGSDAFWCYKGFVRVNFIGSYCYMYDFDLNKLDL